MSSSTCDSYYGPSLVMDFEPETKYRFRYESEGGSHGGLTAKRKKNGKKAYPTVKLINYNGPYQDIFIRVTLNTEKKTEHVLEFKKKISRNDQNYIDVHLRNDYTAEFKNLTILSKKKEEIYQALLERKIRNLGRNLSRTQREKFERENSEEIKKESKEILNSVILRFDAFEMCRPDVSVCPPLYSEPICNQKASSKGDLKIHRMSKIYGSCQGEEEVILLCDKVQKDNIKILFYETDDTGGRWEAYATFSPADVHYQVAIPFKTPPYRDNVEKTVAVCLERQGEKSEPRTFTYIPDDLQPKKRKKCVPESTLNFLSPTFSLSPTSSNAVVSDDSLNDVVVGTLQDIKLSPENENILGSSDTNDADLPSSVLNVDFNLNDFLNLTLPNFLTDPSIYDCVDGENVPFSNILDQMDLDGFQEIPCSGNMKTKISIDVGQTVGQMGITDCRVPGFAWGSTKFLYKRETCKEISENEKKQLKKYLHLISKRDHHGNTLLHLAVYHRKNIGIIMCMNQMANNDIINVQNDDKQTALHIAVQRNVFMVKNLLTIGADPNIRNAKGNNCFHLAASLKNYECLEDLLKYSKFPPQLNEFNYDGLTPLHVALINSEICFCLLRKSVHCDTSVEERKCGKSLLHLAVQFQPFLVSALLEEQEIDVNTQDYEGNTPLHIACMNKDTFSCVSPYDVVKMLLLAGADPLIRNFSRSSVDLEESSDEETPIGQIPADLTTNPKILELLKQATDKMTSNDVESDDSSGSNKTSEILVKKLSNLLDPDMKWKKVAIYVIDEKFCSSLECSPSPTKALLEYMKKNTGDGYIEEFKSVLEMVGFEDAVKIINE